MIFYLFSGDKSSDSENLNGSGIENASNSSHTNEINAATNQLGLGFEKTSSPIQYNETQSLLPPVISKDTNVNHIQSDNLFNQSILKNDINDDFDESRLLSFVPKSKQNKARELLKKFDERGSELTWNSSGIIFVNQVAIPNSNIFLCFPYLYKQKRPKSLPGFDSLLNQIFDMGLQDFISVKHSKRPKVPPENLAEPLDKLENVPWWYLGP